jgi:AraC-like DNA-binding protein
MFSVLHTPAAPLSAFVSNLWSLSDAPSHARERIVPSGTFELVINLNEDEFRIYESTETERVRRFSGAMVSGAYGSSFVIDTREHASVIGVHFKPGGALPFLGHPPGMFGDSHIDLETLWGARAIELRDRLCSAPTSALRFQILEGALLAWLSRPFKRHGVIPVALDELRRGTSVGEIVRQVDLSHRRFSELFTAQVGITPKLYGRIQRFQRASGLARQCSSPDWCALAAECGYFDQSHLIRDFIAFSGLSPVEFLRQSSPELKEGHVALLDREGSNSSNTPAASGLTLP